MTSLLICSGGLDSVSLAYNLAYNKKLKAIISFDYNQRHKKELLFAKQCASDLSVDFEIFDLSNITKALDNSALTSAIDVPDGHYAEKTMKITEVPNRNAIFLCIAFAAAVKKQVKEVALAVHGGDHFIYPDCRPDFLQAFNEMEKYSLEGRVSLNAPYATITKADIVKDGAKYNTPFEKTWSCYKGREIHCGRCGTCVERREAFFLAKIEDPTIYEDNDFWQKTILNFNKE
ncbi:7-cyano-7-deazaguanine synthase QueC [Bartonella sp. TP]|uniref:7-cyano-7-deazaguanine synthase QueC n=1 Tax=Bartonella sp. TP TaxID=3057550 RepID=UPI0025B25C69|nr:7-cyano-7-deazaguanine synthase QueC [Bartonella sp. TP]WJW79952.1 7-cyano-7-deazaguanine synthase QueC [Bartonella sp. TP]